jgi:chemotaxis protein CheD
VNEPPPHGAKPLPQAFLTPGTLYCGAEPAVVSTVLGSCVAVCLVDRHHRAAGMNHFVLPYNPTGENSLRYGDVALERLRARMAELGCHPGDLRAKVFGGAAVLPFGDAGDTVGTKNVRTAVEWLREQSIPVLAQRTGGTNGLLVRFHTGTGRVLVRKISSGARVDPADPVPTQDLRLDSGAPERV